jgi:hypothetical protein
VSVHGRDEGCRHVLSAAIGHAILLESVRTDLLGLIPY